MQAEQYAELEDGQCRQAKKQLTVRLAYPVLAHLELMALQQGHDKNRLIRLAVYEFLQRNGVKNPHKI